MDNKPRRRPHRKVKEKDIKVIGSIMNLVLKGGVHQLSRGDGVLTSSAPSSECQGDGALHLQHLIHKLGGRLRYEQLTWKHRELLNLAE